MLEVPHCAELRLGIVATRWHQRITTALLDRACAAAAVQDEDQGRRPSGVEAARNMDLHRAPVGTEGDAAGGAGLADHAVGLGDGRQSKCAQSERQGSEPMSHAVRLLEYWPQGEAIPGCATQAGRRPLEGSVWLPICYA